MYTSQNHVPHTHLKLWVKCQRNDLNLCHSNYYSLQNSVYKPESCFDKVAKNTNNSTHLGNVYKPESCATYSPETLP